MYPCLYTPKETQIMENTTAIDSPSRPRSEAICSPQESRLVYAFKLSAALVLFLTGVAKLISAFQHVPILGVSDPLFQFLSNQEVLLLAGTLEVVVSAFLVLSRPSHSTTQIGVVLWLCSLFVCYRLGLWWIGYQEPCSCLGDAAQWLHVDPRVMGALSKAILLYLLTGSITLSLIRWSTPPKQF